MEMHTSDVLEVNVPRLYITTCHFRPKCDTKDPEKIKQKSNLYSF
jgi:hypothetical protein